MFKFLKKCGYCFSVGSIVAGLLFTFLQPESTLSITITIIIAILATFNIIDKEF